MKKYVLAIILLSLLLQGCNRDADSKKEIENKITQLYTTPEATYLKKPDASLFTSEVVALVQNAKKMTAMDEERIKNSDSPTDKPMIIEGSIFCSSYDGFTTYTLKDIAINDSIAKVAIAFEYNTTPKETWTDTIVLKNDTSWKIDNILYSKKYTPNKDLKEILDLKTK